MSVAVLAALTGAGAAAGQTSISLELEFAITSAGGEPFGEVSDVEFLADDAFAVLDGQARSVYLFDATGDFRSRLGGEGQGPAEIGGADHMAIDARGDLSVLDFSNLRLNRWASDGTHRGSTPIRELIPDRYFPLGLAAWDGVVFVKSIGFRDGDGIALNRLDDPDTSELVYEWQEDEPSCVYCAWTPNQNGFALAEGDTIYRIHQIEADGSGRLAWSRTDLPASRRPEAEAARMNQMAARQRGIEGGSEELRDQFAWLPRFTMASGVLSFDREGRLWAVPSTGEGEEGRIDIFAPGGDLLESIRLPHRVLGIALSAGRLAVRSETAVGEPAVMIYRR